MSVQGVYICYPIDQRETSASMVSFYEAIEFFERNLIQSKAAGWTFDPGDAFNVGLDAVIDDTLPRINRCALANADVVAAFLPAGVASVGVPIEIDRAVGLGKAVVVFSDAKAWMLNDPHGRIRRYFDWSEKSMLEAVEWVMDLEVDYTNQRDPDPLHVVTSHGDQVLPTRAYPDDAGLDLYVSQDTVIAPGAFSDVPCGLRAALPPWSWGLLTGRSSALRRHGLLVHTGVIDAGYRGPLYAGAFNLTDEPVEVKAGERIAQLIILHNATRNVMVEQVDALPVGSRGTAGFGSSGA